MSKLEKGGARYFQIFKQKPHVHPSKKYNEIDICQKNSRAKNNFDNCMKLSRLQITPANKK